MTMEFLAPDSSESASSCEKKQASLKEAEEHLPSDLPEDMAEMEQTSANQAMDAAYTREIDQLLTQMQASSAQERRATKRMGICTVLLGCGLEGSLFMLWLGWITIAVYSVFLLVLGALLVLNLRAMKRFHKQSQAVMAQISADVRAVGALLSFLESQNKYHVTLAIYSILKHLLPLMRSDHARLLSGEQMRILLKLLRYTVKRDDDLTLSIVKALEQVGDRRAIEPVQRLLSGQPPAIRNAALQCMPFLTLRAQEQDRARTLLRPSQAEAVSPETLLRPLAAPGELDGAQLLRPTEEL